MHVTLNTPRTWKGANLYLPDGSGSWVSVIISKLIQERSIWCSGSIARNGSVTTFVTTWPNGLLWSLFDRMTWHRHDDWPLQDCQERMRRWSVRVVAHIGWLTSSDFLESNSRRQCLRRQSFGDFKMRRRINISSLLWAENWLVYSLLSNIKDQEDDDDSSLSQY